MNTGCVLFRERYECVIKVEQGHLRVHIFKNLGRRISTLFVDTDMFT